MLLREEKQQQARAAMKAGRRVFTHIYSAASALSASAAANPTKHNNPLPMDEMTSPST
jgi:hypothetical protein